MNISSYLKTTYNTIDTNVYKVTVYNHTSKSRGFMKANLSISSLFLALLYKMLIPERHSQIHHLTSRNAVQTHGNNILKSNLPKFMKGRLKSTTERLLCVMVKSQIAKCALYNYSLITSSAQSHKHTLDNKSPMRPFQPLILSS